MIADDQFRESIKESCKLARELGLSSSVYWDRYAAIPASIFGIENYVELYSAIVNEHLFNIQFLDSALLSFAAMTDPSGHRKISYCYYPSPFTFPTYTEWLRGYDFEPDEVGDQFREDYEHERDESAVLTVPTTIRYDYAPNQYREQLHSAGHLHFGQNNSIRIPSERVWSPLSFFLFVVRHPQHNHWFVNHADEQLTQAYLRVRPSSPEIPAEFFSDIDRRDIYLN